jgi:hypothetical protein
VGEREASGDFGYLTDDDYSTDDPAEVPVETDVPDVDASPAHNGAFDAFDADTWYFEPDPPPWYRRK